MYPASGSSACGKARGLRVTDVAAAVGLTEGSILGSYMEGGQTKGATLVVGLRLAKLLGVTPDYLATGAECGADNAGPLRVVLSRIEDHERRLAAVENRPH